MRNKKQKEDGLNPSLLSILSITLVFTSDLSTKSTHPSACVLCCGHIEIISPPKIFCYCCRLKDGVNCPKKGVIAMSDIPGIAYQFSNSFIGILISTDDFCYDLLCLLHFNVNLIHFFILLFSLNNLFGFSPLYNINYMRKQKEKDQISILIPPVLPNVRPVVFMSCAGYKADTGVFVIILNS